MKRNDDELEKVQVSGKGEVVHHVNGVKDDNRLENLKLMDWGEHTKHHRKEDN